MTYLIVTLPAEMKETYGYCNDCKGRWNLLMPTTDNRDKMHAHIMETGHTVTVEYTPSAICKRVEENPTTEVPSGT